MTLTLAARQRAMLDEMGIKVWWPLAPGAIDTPSHAIETIANNDAAADVAGRSDTQAPAAVAGRPPGTVLRPEPAGTPVARAAATPVAAPLQAGTRPLAPAPSAATRSQAGAGEGTARVAAVWVEPAKRLYADTGPAHAGWLIVADMPPGPDGRHGAPFDGDPGRLLDQMLRALRLHAGGVPVHLMRTHRAAGEGASAAAADGPQPFAESFAVQAAALAPRVVLAMGTLAAQALQGGSEPLGRLRGRALAAASLPGVPVVATYPPAYLLRNPADKARAWADLCLAAELAGRAPS